MTVQHKDIHEAVNAVMQEVGYVQKKRSGELRYTYAGEAALIEAIRPSMVEHGIYMHVLEVKKIYRSTYETKSGTNMFNTLIEGIIRFAHVSGTYIDAQATGEGSDSGDKSANKAMTGMYKYAMRQTFCIETGDDPDGFDSGAMERKSASNPTRTTPQASGTRVVNAHQKPVNASETQKTSDGAVAKAETLSEGHTGNQILANTELVAEIVSLTGKPAPEVCGYVAKLEKGKKFTIGEIVKALNPEEA